MTPTEALDRVLDVATDNYKYNEPTGADELREVVRRDWAVRVLDAWALLGRATVRFDCEPFGERLCLITSRGMLAYNEIKGEPVSARQVAAEKVWPDLPESVRARIGECP